jgi:hypothetical protein
MTPSQLVQHFRENQNGNKTLKTVFRNQFLGKWAIPAKPTTKGPKWGPFLL